MALPLLSPISWPSVALHYLHSCLWKDMPVINADMAIFIICTQGSACLRMREACRIFWPPAGLLPNKGSDKHKLWQPKGNCIRTQEAVMLEVHRYFLLKRPSNGFIPKLTVVYDITQESWVGTFHLSDHCIQLLGYKQVWRLCDSMSCTWSLEQTNSQMSYQ